MQTLRAYAHFAILLFLCLTVAHQSIAQTRLDYVDLNAPNAFERLKVSNPKHYESVQAILQGLAKRDPHEVAAWIRTSFNATNVLYDDILLVTEPPQKELVFVLDKVRYRARVTLERNAAKIYTIRNQ